jgi:hypothetical protein
MFPTFILLVDDSSDCTISGSVNSTFTTPNFDSQLVGSFLLSVIIPDFDNNNVLFPSNPISHR